MVVTPQFLATYHKRLGDTLTLDLATPKQIDQGFDGSQGAPAGPHVQVRIVGVGNTIWDSVNGNGPGRHGAVIASPGLYARYPANMAGTSGQAYINALIRLKGGTAAIPAFRADLARVTGRSDIDVLGIQSNWVDPIRRLIQYESACLLALAALVAALFLAARRHRATPRRSSVAAAAAAAGLPVPLVVGSRFALEPGRGRTAVPVRPALLGAIVGVLGVLAAFTFSAGVSDAAANPARFGQTWQLDTYLGATGQDFSPATSQVLRAVAADPEVTGVDDALVGGAQSGQVSVESFTYTGVSGKRIPVILTGGPAARTFTVTGTGFVPPGSHNNYDDGAWLTLAGYDRVFHGAQIAFKFHLAVVSLRPGADVAAASRRLTAAAAGIKGGQSIAFEVSAPPPLIAGIKDVAVLPLALAAFLALLAVAAVGSALSLAVRRRRHELAVLRALGLTRRQSRLVVVTQATLLAVIGLAFGIPLGVAAGRALWRAAAGLTPLAYHTPAAWWALVLIAPVALVAANLLAGWPGHRAARLRTAEILRTE